MNHIDNGNDQSIMFFRNYPGRGFWPPYPAGSYRKDAGKSPDPAGKCGKSPEHGSSIPAGNCPDFFR